MTSALEEINALKKKVHHWSTKNSFNRNETNFPAKLQIRQAFKCDRSHLLFVACSSEVKKGTYALWTVAADWKRKGNWKWASMSHDDTCNAREKESRGKVKMALQALIASRGILTIAMETCVDYQKNYPMARFLSRFWHCAVCQISRCTQNPAVSVKIPIFTPSVWNKNQVSLSAAFNHLNRDSLSRWEINKIKALACCRTQVSKRNVKLITHENLYNADFPKAIFDNLGSDWQLSPFTLVA